jgi:hypothetical protein
MRLIWIRWLVVTEGQQFAYTLQLRNRRAVFHTRSILRAVRRIPIPNFRFTFTLMREKTSTSPQYVIANAVKRSPTPIKSLQNQPSWLVESPSVLLNRSQPHNLKPSNPHPLEPAHH